MEHDLATTPTAAPASRVRATPAADPAVALAHLRAKLAFETDPADLAADQAAGVAGVVVVDARQPDGWAAGHLPGAINLPHATLDRSATAHLDPSATYVTYCWGPACNASTKAAANLAALGFSVKELIGGLSAWQAEGFPVEAADGTSGHGVGTGTPVACHC